MDMQRATINLPQSRSAGNVGSSPHTSSIAVWLFFGMLMMSGIAGASDERLNRQRELLLSVQQQLQEASEQVSTLEEEKKKLTLDLEQATKTAKNATAKAMRLTKKLKEEQATRKQTENELIGTKQKLAETAAQLAETAKSLAQTSNNLEQMGTEKKKLETIKANNEREIAICQDKNAKLYGYGRELMTKYENKSCADSLIQTEPFTGLKKVEIENLLENYRDKLDDQRILTPPGK